MRTRDLGIGLPCLLALACGSAPPPAQAPAAPPVAVAVRPVTPAQLALAHFKTADGVYGLVLDRTGPKPKYRLDGQPEVVELTMQEDRFAGDLRGYFLVATDGKRPIYITASGAVVFEHGNDELPLLSDGDAAPLPAPTVSGRYTPAAPPSSAPVARLTPISVRVKFPSFKPEDAANLGKVGDALEQAAPEMFVHYASHGDKDGTPRADLVPAAFRGIEFGGVARETDEKWDPKAKGLARYGGKNQGFSRYDTPKGNHMQVMRQDGYPPPLAEGTPGLVWEVDANQAVFVTLDGGRYVVDLSRGDAGATLEAGAGSPGAWPPPPLDGLLDVPAVSSLVKAGALPQRALDDLLAEDDAWNRCAAKTWSEAERAIDSGRFTDADWKDMEKKARARCAAPIARQEALLVRLIEARLKDRQSLFERAKSRLATPASQRALAAPGPD